jgi:hypothetical protein
MVEEQVQPEIPISNLQQNLSANKGESRPKFEQEFLHMIDQRLLDFAFFSGVGGAKKVEKVGVFEDLRSHV